MRRNNPQPGDQWHPLIFYMVAVIILVADQLSKTAIRSLLDPGQSIPETGFIRFTHVQNTGAAFGIFYGYTFILSIFSLIGISIMLYYAFYLHKRYPLLNSKLGAVVLGLVMGGTTGNLVDRLRLGYVTDFIDIGPWPMFNIADSCINVGIIIFAFILLISIRAEKI